MFSKYLICFSLIFIVNSYDPFENLNYNFYYNKVVNNIKNKDEVKLWMNLTQLGIIHLYGLSNQEVNIPLAYTYFSLSAKKGNGDAMYFKAFIMQLELDPLSRKHFKFYKKTIKSHLKKKNSILNNVIEVDMEILKQIEKLIPQKREDILEKISQLTDKKIIIKQEKKEEKEEKVEKKKNEKKKKLTKKQKADIAFNKKMNNYLSLYKQYRQSKITKLLYESGLKESVFAQFRIGNNLNKNENCFNSLSYLLNGFRLLLKRTNPQKLYMKYLKISLEEELLPSKKNSLNDMIKLIEENEVYSSSFKNKRDEKYNFLKTSM